MATLTSNAGNETTLDAFFATRKIKLKPAVLSSLKEDYGIQEPGDFSDLMDEDISSFILDSKLNVATKRRFERAYREIKYGEAVSSLPQGETKDDNTNCLPIAPLVPSVQGLNTDDLPIAQGIAVTAVLVSSNINSSSSFEDNEQLIRDQLEQEYRSQLVDKDAQIQRLQALASASSSAGETKASVRIDCFLFFCR